MLRLILVLVSLCAPRVALSESISPFSDRIYSGTIQNGDGSSFVVTLTLDASGNGSLVSSPGPSGGSWTCKGTLIPQSRKSEEVRNYDYVLSKGSSDECVRVAVVTVSVSDGVGKLGYAFKWQDPEKPSHGYRSLGKLTDIKVGQRDVASMVAQFDDLFQSDQYVLIENFGVTTDDFSAMMVWKGWSLEKIESSQDWPEFTDEFAERREKKAFRDRLLARAAELDRSADEIAFKFTGTPVTVGDYDFKQNRVALCVMVQSFLSTDDQPAPAVEFDWESAGGCAYDEFAMVNSRIAPRGAQVWINFNTLEEGEEFTKRVRSMRLTSDVSCGGAVPLPDGNFRYGNFSFFCAPSTLVIYGTDGDIVYQAAFDDGQWWEERQVPLNVENNIESAEEDIGIAVGSEVEGETDGTVYIGRADGQVRLSSQYWTEVDWPRGHCVNWVPEGVIFEPSALAGRVLLKTKFDDIVYTLKTLRLGETWNGMTCQ